MYSGVCQLLLSIDDCMENYLSFFDDNVSPCMYSSGILMHYIPFFILLDQHDFYSIGTLLQM